MHNNYTDNEILNMGTPAPEIKIMELAELLCKLSEKNLKIVACEPQEGSISRRCPDMSKTIKLTNHKPSIGLREGLTDTFNCLTHIRTSSTNRTLLWFTSNYF